jgi:hypothetical protein
MRAFACSPPPKKRTPRVAVRERSADNGAMGANVVSLCRLAGTTPVPSVGQVETIRVAAISLQKQTVIWREERDSKSPCAFKSKLLKFRGYIGPIPDNPLPEKKQRHFGLRPGEPDHGE